MNSNIIDVAPLLASYFIDVDDDVILAEANAQLIAHNISQIGLFSTYLFDLHDSWIISSTVTDDIFSITLNDFITHLFADALIKKEGLGVEHSKLEFPIILQFDLDTISFNTVDDNGNITIIDPVVMHEYLYEQIIKVEKEFIQLGLVVWGKQENDRAEYVLVLINAKNINLLEKQDQAWNKLFSKDYSIYYDYFKSERKAGRYLANISKCLELLSELT